jgi:hypothetical protein
MTTVVVEQSARSFRPPGWRRLQLAEALETAGGPRQP